MTSTINLECLPQLVMEKITSFFDHKQLVAFEQVSRKLKCAVHAHFSTTDHLIIGPLPEVEYYFSYDQSSAKDKKCMNGLLKIITRCGFRLRTIQMTTYTYPGATSIESYRGYFKHFFASAELSNNCPNITNIIASPNVVHQEMFRQQNVFLDVDDAEIYANNIKVSTGGSCKLQSIKLPFLGRQAEHSYQRIVHLFSNLEQISVCDTDETFYKFLPQLIKNGLRDLCICDIVNIEIAKKYSNAWKDLQTLRFMVIVDNVDDIEILNKLHLPKNVEITIRIYDVDDCFARLSKSVCKYIVDCSVNGTTDYRQITKLKNLRVFNISNSEQMQLITEGSFPKLRAILNRCTSCHNQTITNTCDLQTFLPQLLIKKGNQLSHINIRKVCNKSMHVVWRVLQHCKAAKNIQLSMVGVDSPITVTYEDVDGICHLPNLQHFKFTILQKERHINQMSLIISPFHAILDKVVKEHTNFQVKYKFKNSPHEVISLYRIKF